MLYEFSFQFHFLDLFKILMFVLPICMCFFSNIFESKLIRTGIILIALLMGTLILIVFFINPVCSYREIKKNINEGNISVVEGEVNNFETPVNAFVGHNSESFTVDGIEFCYYGTENYGYSKFLCDGGVITGNGQKLRITYCEDSFTGELVICCIEEMTNIGT